MATIIKPRRGLKSNLPAAILADHEFVILTDDQSAYYQVNGVKTKITDILFFPGYIDFPGLSSSILNLSGNLSTGDSISIGNITITAGNEFLIGATKDVTANNVVAVINNINIVSGGYSGLIRASYNQLTGDIRIVCDIPGTVGDNISTSVSGSNLSITAFSGGFNPADDKLYMDLSSKRMYIFYNGLYHSLVANTTSTISSLFSEKPDFDLMPIYEWQGQTGLFEINSTGDFTPILGNNSDLFFELNVYNDIAPKI